MPRTLRLEEPDGVWSELVVPSRHLSLLHAAAGIVAMAPDGDGRARTLERFAAGGKDAVCLAVEILEAALTSERDDDEESS